ncbi:hypothetical protein ACHAWO_011382 [Cyclotella atomus]|uniref:Circumsporozoite protein n=1 Tax=Cyclotella atomus TaxID=382360 RepID=A0ABD3P537_9STRA
MKLSAVLPLLLAHEAAAGRTLIDKVPRIRNHKRANVKNDAPRRLRLQNEAADDMHHLQFPIRRNLSVDKRDKLSMSMPFVTVFSFPVEEETDAPSAISSVAPTVGPTMSATDASGSFMSVSMSVPEISVEDGMSTPVFSVPLEVFTSMPSSGPTISSSESLTNAPSAAAGGTEMLSMDIGLETATSVSLSLAIGEFDDFSMPTTKFSLSAPTQTVDFSMPIDETESAGGIEMSMDFGLETSAPVSLSLPIGEFDDTTKFSLSVPTQTVDFSMPIDESDEGSLSVRGEEFEVSLPTDKFSLSMQDFDDFSLPIKEEPVFTSMLSLSPSIDPTASPSGGPIASPTASPSNVLVTASPTVLEAEIMSLPLEEDFEFEETVVSLSLPNDQFNDFSMAAGNEVESSDAPSGKPISAAPTTFPSVSPIQTPTISPVTVTDAPTVSETELSLPLEEGFEFKETDMSLSMPDEDFSMFVEKADATDAPTDEPTMNPSTTPSKSPSASPIRSPTVSPSKTPSIKPTASPIETIVDAESSMSMSLPSDPDFDEFDGIDDNDSSMSMFDVFSVPESTNEPTHEPSSSPSIKPSYSPTVSTSPSFKPSLSPIIAIVEVESSMSMSMPSDPDFDEFDGLDDEAASLSMPHDYGIFSVPEVTDAPTDDPSKSLSSKPSSTPTASPSLSPIEYTEETKFSISMSMPLEQEFDDFDGLDTESSMSTVIVTMPTLPEEEVFDGFDIQGQASISLSLPSLDEGSDGVGGGWWQIEESMPHGDRLDESVSMSIPDDGFDGVGDSWWLDGESMPHADRPEASLSLSLSLPSPDEGSDGIGGSLSLPSPDEGSDGVGGGWWQIEESMPHGDRLDESVSMSIPDDGFDGIGDWWWLDGESMPTGERPLSLSLSLSFSFSMSNPDDAEESFSNDVEEYRFMWAL